MLLVTAKALTLLLFVHLCSHVEGKLGVSGLDDLPSDLFDRMASLTLLSLNSHQNLTRLPSLRGLKRIRTLVLERLPALTELPDLAIPASKLERVQVGALPLVSALPDLMSIKSRLEGFTLASSSAVCCNGFLDHGACDLNRPGCTATTCASTQASEATQGVIKQFAASVCQLAAPNATAVSERSEISRASVDVCNGTLYKECSFTSNSSSNVTTQTGMCYNSHLQVIHCAENVLAIEMRRQQIAQSVGAACDRDVEAWLGCA